MMHSFAGRVSFRIERRFPRLCTKVLPTFQLLTHFVGEPAFLLGKMAFYHIGKEFGIGAGQGLL
jgi:hypothetical protein